MISRVLMILFAAMMAGQSAVAREPGFPLLALQADSLQPAWSANVPHIILPGQRTKIAAPGLVSHSLLGKIYTIRPDTIVLVTDRFYPGEPDAWKIPLQNIKKYQIPQGYRDHAMAGAIIGSCLGAALSTVFALVDNQRSPADRTFPYPATVTGGGIIGGLTGALTRSELWRTVPIDQLRLGLPLPEEPIPLHTIVIGERVRVLAPDLGKHYVVGSIYAIGDDNITLVDDPNSGGEGKYRQVPLDRIDLYQISIAKQTHSLMGALAGVWGGIFLGTMKGGLDRESSGEEPGTSSIIPFAVSGMIAGALIGINVKTDQWKIIPVDRLRLK